MTVGFFVLQLLLPGPALASAPAGDNWVQFQAFLSTFAKMLMRISIMFLALVMGPWFIVKSIMIQAKGQEAHSQGKGAWEYFIWGFLFTAAPLMLGLVIGFIRHMDNPFAKSLYALLSKWLGLPA